MEEHERQQEWVTGYRGFKWGLEWRLAAGVLLWTDVAPAPPAALSYTLLPLHFTVTISFTADGPPPASLRSVIKCHRLHTLAAPNG